jgi:hypothetical protein
VADEEAMRLKPPAKYGRVFTELAPAPSRGGGSGSTKTKQKPVIADVSGTIGGITSMGFTKIKSDTGGKGIDINVDVPNNLEYDKSVNTPSAKSVTILVNDEVEALNPRFKELGIKQIRFRPTNQLRTKTKDGYTLTSVGDEVIDAVNEDGETVQVKSLKPYIPYEMVRGAVEESYGTEQMNEIYTELEIGQKPQKKTSIIENPTAEQHAALKPGDKFIYNGKEYTKE